MSDRGDRAWDGLGQKLDALRLSGSMCDVVLAVDGQDFPAHSLVLKATSPVFATMLTGEHFREAAEGRVTVQDVDKDVFDKFLEFLYTDMVRAWEGRAVDLLELADRYMVAHLKEECERRLKSMDVETAVNVLSQGEHNIRIDSPLRFQAACVLIAQGRLDAGGAAFQTKWWSDLKEALPVVADVIKAMWEYDDIVEGVRRNQFYAASTPPLLGAALNSARKDGKLCDVFLHAGDTMLPAHKVVLTTCSPLFACMFLGDGEDAKPDMHVEGMPEGVVDKFLEFMYTNCVQNWDNFELELLELAHRFEVDLLWKECNRRLTEMDFPTALRVLRMADKSSFIEPELRCRAAKKVLRKNQALDTPEWAEFQSTSSVVLADVLKAGVRRLEEERQEAESAEW